MNDYSKSPIFYMGSKWKLLTQILPYFPERCETFVDGFGGGGVVSLNYNGARQYVYNEINPNVVGLVNTIKSEDIDELDRYYKSKIAQYNLITLSGRTPMGAEGYYKMREDYNKSQDKDYKDLYLLMCYSINHLMRFNGKNEFNAPNGDNAYNDKNYEQLKQFKDKFKKVSVINHDIFALPLLDEMESDDFLYCDPPYSNSMAVYNEKRAYGGWTIDDDYRLFALLEQLDEKGVKWALSNVFSIRGKENTHIKEWCENKRWTVKHLSRNYNPFSKGNSCADEVLIMNY